MLLSFSMDSELHSSKRRRNASKSASRVKVLEVFRPTFLPAKIWLSLAQRVEIESTIIERNQWAHQNYKIPSWIERNPPTNLRKDNQPVETDERNWRNRLHALTWTDEPTSGNQQSVLWLVRLTKRSNLIGWFSKRSELRKIFVNILFTKIKNKMCFYLSISFHFI